MIGVPSRLRLTRKGTVLTRVVSVSEVENLNLEKNGKFLDDPVHWVTWVNIQ